MLPPPASNSSPAESRPWGNIIALVAVVTTAYITIFVDATSGANPISFTPFEMILLFATGLSSAWLIFNQQVIQRLLPTPIQLGGYYTVQIVLIGLLGFVARGQGQWWLVILPVIAHSAEQSWGWIMGVSGCSLTMIVVVYGMLSGNWQQAGVIPIYIGSAFVFVVIFSRIALRERTGREQIEQLALELREANHKLSLYAAKVEELATIQERNRLAREIHDTLGHYLTVINVQLGAAAAVMEKNPEKARQALQKAQKLTQEGLIDVRQSVAALRAHPADLKPLPELLQELLTEIQNSGVQAELHIQGEARPVSPQVQHTLYRAVQEGLTNVRKYAQASQVQVWLTYQTDEKVQLVVQDNGRGAENISGGFGLLGLRERVQLIGGQVEIQTAPQQGLTLTVTLPITLSLSSQEASHESY